MREINSAGFLGRYDFFYLPMDPRSHANRGFAFVNFVTSEIAADFYRMFHSQQLKHFNSERSIAVMPADLQGFEQNANHYAASRVLRRKRATNSKPLFFRALPEHLTVDDNIEVYLDQPMYSPDQPALADGANPWQMQLPTAGNDFLLPGRGQDDPGVVRDGAAPSRAMNGVGNPNRLARRMPAQEAPADGQASRFPKFQGASPLPKFCGFCGNPRRPEHTFCPYCGARFQVNTQTT